MLNTDFTLTSGFTGFSISCSSITITVEHDDRHPCDEVRAMALAGPAPSQEEATDLLELLRMEAAVVDLSELTDWTLLSLSELVWRRSESAGFDPGFRLLVDLLRDSSFIS